jgi:hypothetical protein
MDSKVIRLRLCAPSRLDFASLRNDRRSESALKTLAGRVAEDVNYADLIQDADIASLADNDLFKQVEQRIASGLARQVAERTISDREVTGSNP